MFMNVIYYKALTLNVYLLLKEKKNAMYVICGLRAPLIFVFNVFLKSTLFLYIV